VTVPALGCPGDSRWDLRYEICDKDCNVEEWRQSSTTANAAMCLGNGDTPGRLSCVCEGADDGAIKKVTFYHITCDRIASVAKLELFWVG
jgi:hypothetical protein